MDLLGPPDVPPEIYVGTSTPGCVETATNSFYVAGVVADQVIDRCAQLGAPQLEGFDDQVELLTESLTGPVCLVAIMDLLQRFREGESAGTSVFSRQFCFLEKLTKLPIGPSEVHSFVANPSCNGYVNLGQEELYPGCGACNRYDHASNPFHSLYGGKNAFIME